MSANLDQRVNEALRLDTLWEEAAELLYEEAWEDEWKKAMLRQQFIQSRLLAQVAANTGRLPDVFPGEVIVDPREPIAEKENPEYWVTEETIEVENTNGYQAVNWEFPADTVVLLFSDDCSFSFLPPGDVQNREFTLDADDYSPFSISGVDGLYADRVWYEQAGSATTTPELDIIAVG